MSKFDKNALLQQILEDQKRKLVLLVQTAFEAKEASTNEESKAENKYDTRGLEASYLAAGQAKRAQELQEKIYNLEKIQIKSFKPDDEINVGAVVQLVIDDEDSRWFFLLPAGGIETQFHGHKIQSLTRDAPLGNFVYGQKLGDEFQLNNKEYEIGSVL